MINVFREQADLNLNIDRDTYDWTHANNFTARLGYIYPFFRRLLPPNSKVTIDTNLGLQFMPMSFPVQTPMKCKVSFYKVPLRTLWKDYMDYVGNFRQGLEEPYHSFENDEDFEKFFGECQLGDYLDIPNILFGTFGSRATLDSSLDNYKNTSLLLPLTCSNADTGGIINPEPNAIISYNPDFVPSDNFDNEVLRIPFGRIYDIDTPLVRVKNYKILDFNKLPIRFNDPYQIPLGECFRYAYLLNSNNEIIDGFVEPIHVVQTTDDNNFNHGLPYYTIVEQSKEFNFKFQSDQTSKGTKLAIGYEIAFVADASTYNTILDGIYTNGYIQEGEVLPENLTILLEGSNSNAQYSVINRQTTPYFDKTNNPEGKKLSSYSARAYEAIYNAYIRDPRNNPLLDDQGQPVYNKWLLNQEGGEDNFPYRLHRDNWEYDFLTSAVQSPQQGVAPLVGLTQYVTQSDDQLSYNLALVDEDGKKYSVNYQLADDNGTKSYTISVGDELPDGTNVLKMSPKQLMDSQTMGFSIPDLRIVNAYQKYLELNIRKSYSYKDIIQGRFDCKVRFDELQMPEFLGGFTRDIQMNRVVQSVDNNIGTTPTYEGSLGSLGGDAYLSANNNHSISCFCDEECIILGLIRIIPQPVYTQLLPKDYLYRDILDHYNPEFANLGLQPITYAEVCPLQAKLFGVNPDDTFGYQRAWYEYVMCNDTAHGLMKTTHRDFLMNRHFKQVPRLNESFLLVDDDQLNDVFTVQDDSDKIIGQAVFSVKTELPINRVQIPRLD